MLAWLSTNAFVSFQKKKVLSMTMLLLAGPMLTVWGESSKLQCGVSWNAIIDKQHSKFSHVRTIQQRSERRSIFRIKIVSIFMTKKSSSQNCENPREKKTRARLSVEKCCEISGGMRSIPNWIALKEEKIYCAADLTTTCVSRTHLVSSTLSYSSPTHSSSLHK